MPKTKHLAQVLFFIIVIVYTAKFIWNETRPNYHILSLVENIAAKNITATKFDNAGNIAYSLTGSSIQQHSSPNLYSINAAQLTKNTDPTWELTAGSALWDQASAHITLKNKVQLLLANTHIATTDWLDINLASNTASTKATVKFQNSTTAITAEGMELDLNQANINLKHNITGRTTK